MGIKSDIKKAIKQIRKKELIPIQHNVGPSNLLKNKVALIGGGQAA